MTTQWWFDYPITNPHSSDDGVDIGTPDNTPVFFPYGGQVIDANYYTYGGQVVVHVPGQPFDEYFIHLNNIYKKKGDKIQPGEVVGTTGGGVGDKLLINGSVQQATSQAQWGGASSGYHTEFGEFKDTSSSGDMGQFNEGWGGQGGKNNGRQYDPTGVIHQLQQEAQNPTAQVWQAIQAGINLGISGAPGAAQVAGQQADNPLNPSNWVPAIIAGLGFSSAGDMFQRVGATVGGMALIGLGLYIAFQSEAQQAFTTVTDFGAQVAGKAAKAAAL